AVGFEIDRGRHATASAIWRTLAERAGDMPKDRCRFVLGPFPTVANRTDTSKAMAIFTNFVTTQSAEELECILTGLKRYRYVLIDLRRFVERRETADARGALVDELARRGFVVEFEARDPNDRDYSFALFRNQSLNMSRGALGAWSRLADLWRN